VWTTYAYSKTSFFSPFELRHINSLTLQLKSQSQFPHSDVFLCGNSNSKWMAQFNFFFFSPDFPKTWWHTATNRLTSEALFLSCLLVKSETWGRIKTQKSIIASLKWRKKTFSYYKVEVISEDTLEKLFSRADFSQQTWIPVFFLKKL